MSAPDGNRTRGRASTGPDVTITPRGHFDGRSRSRTHTRWLWRPVAYQLAKRPYDGDRTCTGVGSLCGGAHTSSATPSSVGTKGLEPFPAGPRPAVRPFTPRLPFRRCQWGLHPPASPYHDDASLPRPWHHEASGEIRTPVDSLTRRALILSEPHRHVGCHVEGARARNEASRSRPSS